MKKKSNKSKRSLLSTTVKANVDNKLTQAAIILEYAFNYNVNFKERVITISREIDEIEFDRLDNALTELEAQNRQTVTIRINSPGGHVYHALAMVGRLKRSPCHIITEGYGHIMSAATMLLAAGDKRKISKYSFFMHHESSYALEGKHSDIKHNVQQMEREEQKWAKWMEELTKKPAKFWLKTGVGNDAYFEAEELVELGVADEVI